MNLKNVNDKVDKFVKKVKNFFDIFRLIIFMIT